MDHHTVDYRHLRKQLQELINQGYLKEFILNPGEPSEVKVQKEAPEAQHQKSQTSRDLVNYREVDGIFGACPLEGTTSRKRSVYINEACRTEYPAVLVGPPLTPSRPIMFSKADAYVVHFPHNDALIITMHIGNCRVSRILIDSGSSVNIMYGGALNRIEDIREMARAIINPQT